MECVLISAASRAYLAEQGEHFDEDFILTIVRADGGTLRVRVASVTRVAQMLSELRPPTVTLMVGQDESEEELAFAIAALVAQACGGETARGSALH